MASLYLAFEIDLIAFFWILKIFLEFALDIADSVPMQ